MTAKLVREIRAALRERGDPAHAAKMKAYMKSEMPFRGVSAPEARRILLRL